ncbi:MAG: hypothetical protein NT169_12990 [Chloroflexi bacterium]|nr:hypothetical protein [Chloroflexota bacterium]
MQSVAQLAHLNDLDLALDALKARLAEIAEALKEPVALRETRRALAAAGAELAGCRARQAEAEQTEQRAADKLIQAEQRLYSGQVRNPKELEDAERDVQQLRRQRGQAEDALLESLLCAEAATEAHAEATRKLARLTAERAAAVAALRAEQAALGEKLVAASARQAAVRGTIPAQLLATYDALRPRKGGRAVAALDGDSCTVCQVAASPGKLAAARDGNELVYCGNCGRVLWAE